MSVRRNRIMSITFISTCLAFLLFLFLTGWDRLSYRAHEFCAVFVNIGLYLIPVEAIIGLFIWINYKMSGERKARANALLNFLSFFAVFATAFILFYLANSVSTSGLANEFDKHASKQGCYLSLYGRLVELSREQYDYVEDGKWYMYEYEYNNLFPNKYKMKYIKKYAPEPSPPAS